MGDQTGVKRVLRSTSMTSKARVARWLAGDSALGASSWASTGDTTRGTRPEQHHGRIIGAGYLGAGDLRIADPNLASGPTAEDRTLSSSTPSEEYGETEIVTDLDPTALATLSPHLRQVLENMQQARREAGGSSSTPLHRSDSEEELTERASEAAKQNRRTIERRPHQSTHEPLPSTPSSDPEETPSSRHYAAMVARYERRENRTETIPFTPTRKGVSTDTGDLTLRTSNSYHSSAPIDRTVATAMDPVPSTPIDEAAPHRTDETTSSEVDESSFEYRLRIARSNYLLHRSEIALRDNEEVEPEQFTATALDQTRETSHHKVHKTSVGRRLRNAFSYRQFPRNDILPRETTEVEPEDSTDANAKKSLKKIAQNVKDKVKTIFGRKKKAEQDEESEEELNRQGKKKRNLRKSASAVSIRERGISHPTRIPPVSTIPTMPIPTEEQRTNAGFTKNTQTNNRISPALGGSPNSTITSTTPRKPVPAPVPAPIMTTRGHIENYQ